MRCESSFSLPVKTTPAELFTLLSQPRLRLQLAPDWGEYDLLQVDPDFPASGSSYRIQLKKPEEVLWTIAVQSSDPPHSLALAAVSGPFYRAEWRVEPDGSGSLLSLDEQIELPEPAEPDDSAETPVPAKPDDLEGYFKAPPLTLEQERQKFVKDWLTTIGRYAGSHSSRSGRTYRWLMDHYLLRLRADQRRIIVALLAMQVVLCLTFAAAVIGLGVAGAILR